MKRFGITTKLFIATAVIFILFYVIVLLCQLLVFPEFYEHRKMHKLERAAVSLAAIYQKNPKAAREPYSKTWLQMHKNGADFTLTDFAGNLTIDDPFRMRMIREDGKVIDVSLSYFVSAYRQDLKRMNINVGEEVELRGEFVEGTGSITFYPHYLKKIDERNAALFQEIGKIEAGGMESDVVRGKVEKISIPNLSKAGIRLGVLYSAMDEFFPLSTAYTEQLRRMEPVEQRWTDPWTGSRNGIIMQPVLGPDGGVKVLFLVTSLQEIKETNSALRLFYGYLGLGGFILIMLLSIFYSRMLTRPLLLLNKRAEDMKQLNFSGGKPIQRKDELGSLSNTLFELSSKLERTLGELNDTNARLRREIEQNKELEQLQKDFFANASHELKTPISIVRGFAEGLRDGISAGRQDHYVSVILEESEKMERLVQDMLDLLRLESPTVKLYKSPILLGELTEDMLEKLVYQLREKRLTARVNRDGEREIMADAAKMEQVVMNLLTNAIRHAEEGSTIQIRVFAEGEACVYSIHNKGEAIPDAYLKRIWERFFRVEPSRDRKSGGTGLGLAIVRRILELHECDYQVENRDGGVRFSLKFWK
ncbi:MULTISPECIES: HAMP domain-containing sensor histidine kinase [Paenibacillus]|uniref:sensor histidine kinase n=1 Tax=Paenibacillus TaxID=44249 RepID=UPI002FE2C576